jgi:hypothetical protein
MFAFIIKNNKFYDLCIELYFCRFGNMGIVWKVWPLWSEKLPIPWSRCTHSAPYTLYDDRNTCKRMWWHVNLQWIIFYYWTQTRLHCTEFFFHSFFFLYLLWNGNVYNILTLHYKCTRKGKISTTLRWPSNYVYNSVFLHIQIWTKKTYCT